MCCNSQPIEGHNSVFIQCILILNQLSGRDDPACRAGANVSALDISYCHTAMRALLCFVHNRMMRDKS